MQFSNVKSVHIGAGTAVAVIAITGAASGSGIGAIFNLGKTNKVNATSTCDFDASAIIGPGVKGP